MNKKIIGITILFSLALVYFYEKNNESIVLRPITKSIPKIELEKVQNAAPPVPQSPQTTSSIVENKIEIPQNQTWRVKVKKDLLAFMPKNTTVNIEVMEELKNEKLKKDVAKITYVKPDGSKSTFKALIESKSGKILRTWDQVVFEPIHQTASIAISGAL